MNKPVIYPSSSEPCWKPNMTRYHYTQLTYPPSCFSRKTMSLNEQLFTQPNCPKLIIALVRSRAVLLELPDPDCSIHCASATLNGWGLRWNILPRTFNTLNPPLQLQTQTVLQEYKSQQMGKPNQSECFSRLPCPCCGASGRRPVFRYSLMSTGFHPPTSSGTWVMLRTLSASPANAFAAFK